MKGKRYTTEQKIRILREADQAGSTIVGVCQEHSISEQTFHRWKREFGMMELDQAKQLKELQKENARLKRMLADEMLGKELLKEALEKNYEPRTQTTDHRRHGGPGPLHRSRSLSALWTASQHVQLRREATRCLDGQVKGRLASHEPRTSRDGLHEDSSPAEAGRLASRLAVDPTIAPTAWLDGAREEAQATALWGLHGATDQSDPSQSRLDVGLRARHDDARW